MFGKLMSIPDDLMWNYYELATDRTEQEIAALKLEVSSGKLHPMDAKMKLGEEVVSTFHGAEAGRKAAENFQRVFRDRQAPEEMVEFVLKPSGSTVSVRCASNPNLDGTTIFSLSSTVEKWSRLLPSLELTSSTSETERLMKQGGLEIDGQSVSDPTARLDLRVPSSQKVRIGKKKFVRIVVDHS